MDDRTNYKFDNWKIWKKSRYRGPWKYKENSIMINMLVICLYIYLSIIITNEPIE